MKKFLLLFLIVSSMLHSQTGVNQPELEKSKPVEFINNTKTTGKGEAVSAIQSIGKSLAGAKGDRYTLSGKYTILHRVDPSSPLLSADVFILEKNARVDHIKNVRRILSGYLVNRYKYSQSDANAIAVFITYYNAVYRGDMNTIKERYSPVVVSVLDAKKAGIALNYREWPGATQMLIPLGDTRKPDAIEISDEKVIDELRKEDKKGIEEREKIVELREKETEREKEKIKKDKEEIKKTETRIEEEKEKIENKKEEIEEKEKEIEKTEDPVKQKEEEEKLAEEKEELVKEEEKLKEEEAKVEEKKEEIESREKEVTEEEKKTEEIKDDIEDDKSSLKDPEEQREELREKEKELEQKADELKQDNLYEGKIYYLRKVTYTTGGHYNNEMYIIDPVSRKVVLKSPYRSISGTKYNVFGGGVVVIGHSDKAGFEQKEHYLVRLALNTLKVDKTGANNIFWRSFIEIHNDHIFAITEKEGKYYVGRFNADLQMVAVSSVAIDPDTFVTFFEKTVFVNSADGGIVVLNEDDLSLAAPIEFR